jgi:hypothetical protein
VPVPGDEFMMRREDTKDWVRFVVYAWSPTANNVANGWETTKWVDGGESSHTQFADGQTYNSAGQAIGGYMWMNACSIGSGCGATGGDFIGFSSFSVWADQGRTYGDGWIGGHAWFWGNEYIPPGQLTRMTVWYRPSGTRETPSSAYYVNPLLQKCNPGQYYSLTVSTCVPCDPGSYATYHNIQSKCTPCPLGWTNIITGATSVDQCNIHSPTSQPSSLPSTVPTSIPAHFEPTSSSSKPYSLFIYSILINIIII